MKCAGNTTICILAGLFSLLALQSCSSDKSRNEKKQDAGEDSGSDTDADTDSDTDADSGPSTDDGCDEMDFPVAGHPPDILILLDKSGSMSWGSPTVWSVVTSALTTVTTQMDSQIRFGMMSFPYGDSCDPPPLTPQVAIDNINSSVIANALAVPAPINGGTPTTAAMNVAATYLDSLDDGSEKYILLATDGAPNCSSDTSLVCPGCVTTWPTGPCQSSMDCLDDADAVATADYIHDTLGIDIYVVGVGGVVGAWDSVMNAIAHAGGTGNYYAAGNATQLQAALAAITSGTVDCRFTVDWDSLDPSASDDPDLVNLFADGDVIPYNANCDSGDEWHWLDSDTIKLCDDICDDYADGEISIVTASFGCETVVE